MRSRSSPTRSIGRLTNLSHRREITQFNRPQPLPNGRGSEGASEPRPLGSGWHSYFLTGPRLAASRDRFQDMYDDWAVARKAEELIR